MTTFRTCDQDMLDFIDWLIKKKRIFSCWENIRHVLKLPEMYLPDYYEYQEEPEEPEEIDTAELGMAKAEAREGYDDR